LSKNRKMEIDKIILEQNVNSHILIVDDNPHNLQVLGKLLQEKNYKIEFATNGRSALEWIESQQFDLILLDINMPEMDGFEVCQTIRKNDKLNKIPVIFLSADSDRESILKGFELGAQDYIAKPFDSRELIVRVKTHLSLKNSLEKLETVNKYLEEKVKERTLQLSKANEDLESMNMKMMELDNAKSDFLSLISHEIRTPLNGILLPLEMLKDPVTADESKELVEILDASVKRLEKFSLNALLITRLKTKPVVSKTDIDLSKVIKEVLTEEELAIKAKSLTVKDNSDAVSCNISGETDLVRKCILNILQNAITFSPTDGIIEILISVKDQHVLLEINDNGTGIPVEIIEKGSEPFSKGVEYHDKSTGIGLPLAKLIMEAHGGEIILSNKPDGGAMVILKFFTE
jgi:two-component system sensor histidine kinase/response regulator